MVDNAEVEKTDGEPLKKDSSQATGKEQAETIKLDQFLKLAHIVQSGGEAKHVIKLGFVMVNGEVEKRRGRKLRDGDVVEIEGDQLVVQITDD